MSDPKPPSRNCAGCNEPNPPHETAAGYCLRCLHKEWIACRNALSIIGQHDADKAELAKSAAAMRDLLEMFQMWQIPTFIRPRLEAAIQCTAGRDYVPRAELERVQTHLLNLLARIHRDGGHYVAQNGLDVAVKSADEIVVGQQATCDESAEREARIDRLQEQNRQLITSNAELATKATEAAEQLLAMTNAEDDARRELVRVRLRLDWLEATGVAKDALKPLVEQLFKLAPANALQGCECKTCRPIAEALNLARSLGLVTPTPEPSRNTAGLHEPVWDSRNSDEPKTEV